MDIDNRREPRQRSLLGGSIMVPRRRCPMRCVVRDISANGALVVLPHSAITPTEFDLYIPHRQQTRSARIVWREHDRAGVALSPMKADAVPPKYAERIRMLEAENLRLRKRLISGCW
jgi:hypothetical protein